MLKRELITSANDRPIDLMFIKDHTDISEADEDDLILFYLDSAIRTAEEETGLKLVTQTWRFYFDSFARLGDIGINDVSSITITYDDEDDVEQTLASSVYYVDDKADPISFSLQDSQSWPFTYVKPNAVRVDVTCGRVEASVEQTLKHGLAMLTAHYYENRGATDTMTVKTVPRTVDHLFSLNRKYRA